MNKPMDVASSLLKKMTTDGSTEEERKELTTQLLKMPKLFNYRMSQMMKEKDWLNEEERAIGYRHIVFSTMTVAHFHLLNELLQWLKKEQQYVPVMAPALFYFQWNCQERLFFFLEHDCLSNDDRKTSQDDSLETLKVKFGRCLEEMSRGWSKTAVRSGGDQLTNREDSKASKKERKNEDFKRDETIEETLRQEQMKRMEAFEKITTVDGAVDFQRRETNIWHKSSVISRRSYFEKKYGGK